MVIGTDASETPLSVRPITDIAWDNPRVDRAARWRALGVRGAAVWLTGLPASGKSTVAGLLEARPLECGQPACRVDGNNLRHGLKRHLGFRAAGRAENVPRAAHVPLLMADARHVAVASLISPYAADRALARRIHAEAGLAFVKCERRDLKGLYVRARVGQIARFTVAGDPYEPPPPPDLELRPGPAGKTACATAVLEPLAAGDVPPGCNAE
jgi:bifunctional enzyme CysN/CysC